MVQENCIRCHADFAQTAINATTNPHADKSLIVLLVIKMLDINTEFNKEKMNEKNILRLGIVVLVLLIAGVLWLNNDINQKEDEANKMPLQQMLIFLCLVMMIQI